MKISTSKLSFMSSKLLAMLLFIFLNISSFAQTIPTPATGDYVSITSGPWGTANTWRIEGGANPSTTVPSFGHNVFIENGHTISLTTSPGCKNLYINTTGSLINSDATTRTLTVGRNLGASETTSVLINNGILGSAADVETAVANAERFDLIIDNRFVSGFPANSTFTISGSGKTKIIGLAAAGAGTNVSPFTDFVKTMTINIDMPMILTGNSGAARTLTINRLSANSVNENYTMNINANVSVLAGGSAFHTGSTTAITGGTYTYNINAGVTLDYSRCSGTTGIIPLPQPGTITNQATGNGNITTVNVAGTWKIGSGTFTTVNGTALSGANTAYAKVALNILDGGLVDGSSNTSFVSFGNMSNAYFNISGTNRTGKFKRNVLVDNTADFVFPIGTPEGYSPVTIRNNGTAADKFTVGVTNDFTGFNTYNALYSNITSLKNRYTIEEESTTATITRLSLGWMAVHENASFDRTKSTMLYYNTEWNKAALANAGPATGAGTAAVTQNTTATNTPTAASPYIFGISNSAGVIQPNGSYSVGTDITTLPLTLLSFTGKLNDFSNEVELKWTTTSEVNTKNFEVLESTDGKSFNVIGTVLAKNTNGIHNYGFNTKSNTSGVLYYQLKQIDLDGKFQLSNVIDVKNKGGLLSVYPNPAQSYIVVNIPQSSGLGNLSIYSQDGKMVYSKAIAENESSRNVNIESFNSGVYFLIISKGKEISSQKFVKQ